MGLGAGSIPLAAALNWIIKDGLGQLGGVIYSTVISSKFDSDPKRHRFWSNVALQASTLLEVVTPLVPQFFLFLASVSNIGEFFFSYFFQFIYIFGFFFFDFSFFLKAYIFLP